MQNNLTQVKCIINRKEIVITCPLDTTTVEIKEGLFQFMKYIGKVEDVHLEQMKKDQDAKVDIPEESSEEMLELEKENVES